MCAKFYTFQIDVFSLFFPVETISFAATPSLGNATCNITKHSWDME